MKSKRHEANGLIISFGWDLGWKERKGYRFKSRWNKSLLQWNCWCIKCTLDKSMSFSDNETQALWPPRLCSSAPGRCAAAEPAAAPVHGRWVFGAARAPASFPVHPDTPAAAAPQCSGPDTEPSDLEGQEAWEWLNDPLPVAPAESLWAQILMFNSSLPCFYSTLPDTQR